MASQDRGSLFRDCLPRGSTPPPIKEKPTLRGWLFFAYYRVFTRVPGGSCGLRREPFLPVTGRFYSPFAHSLSDPTHPAQAEVRKARPSPLYKSMTYARTNQAVFLWHWLAEGKFSRHSSVSWSDLFVSSLRQKNSTNLELAHGQPFRTQPNLSRSDS